MKKRIISLLLVVCMAVALFAGLGATAYADGAADTTAYTVKKGDTLWGLCNKQGINYYTCKNAIMSLNSFTSEYQLTHISVGDTITIPTSDAAGQKLGGSGSSTTTTSTVISGSTSTTTTTTTNALANGDVVSYYLIAHTMISGETVMGIYNAWGLNYRNYSDQILAVNSLTGFNKMYAGKTYLLPCPTIPAGSTAGYSIIAHKVVGGDSAYNLCRTYNTNYNNVSAVIKATNGGSNLTTIKSGQIVYIPATGAVTVAASGSTGGTGSAGGTSTTPVVSTTKYDLTKATAKNGSFVLQSGGAEVSSVGAGASVSIIPTPAYNYVVDSIVVSKASDSSTTVATNSSVFTMPAYAVKVTVTFKLGSTTNSGLAHAISVSSAGGTVTSYVDGKEVTSAKAGSFVTLKIKPNKTYEFSSLQVSYGTYSTSVPVSASNSYKPDAEGYITASFNMPDADTKVVAAYEALKEYNLIGSVPSGNGSFYVTVDGVQSLKAVKGQTVAIIPTPNAGYSMKDVSVTYKNGSAVSMVDALTFIMPAQDVRITMNHAGAYAIKSSAINGTLSYKADGVPVNSAVEGKDVEITATPYSGYTLDSLYVNDVKVTFTADNKATFKMPAGEVTVKATFKAVETFALNWEYFEKTKVDGCSVKFMVDGGYVTSAAKDTLVTVVPVCKDGYILDEFTGVTFEDGSKDTFKMTGSAATVIAKFVEVDKTAVKVNYNSTYFNTPTLLVDGKTMTVTPTGTAPDMTATFAVYPGKNAVLQTSCKEGYALEKATATNTTISDSDVFKVGEDDITITLSHRGQYRSITSGAVLNGSFTMVDEDGNTITNTAPTGDTIYVMPVADRGYEIDKLTETHLVNGVSQTNNLTVDGSRYKFEMPGADVTLNISFKAKTMKIGSLTIIETEAEADVKGFPLKLAINGEVTTNVASAKTSTAEAVVPKDISVPANAEVTLLPVLNMPKYSVVSVVITDESGNNIIDKINYSSNKETNRYTFTMPVDYNNIKITVTVSPDA